LNKKIICFVYQYTPQKMTTHAVHDVVCRLTTASDMNDAKTVFQRTLDFNVSPGVLGKACLLKVRQFMVRADANDTYLWALSLDIAQPNHTASVQPMTGYWTAPSTPIAQMMNGCGNIVALTSGPSLTYLNNSEHATIPIQMQSSSPKVTLSIYNPFNTASLNSMTAINVLIQMEIIPLE